MNQGSEIREGGQRPEAVTWGHSKCADGLCGGLRFKL